MQSVFQSIAGVVGGFIQELGKMLIRTAIQVKVFKQAIEKLVMTNPALAIGLGVGLVAIGAAIKNSIPKFQGFNKGGWVPGSGNSDSVPALLTPGEYVIPKAEAQRMKNPYRGSSVNSMGGIGNMKLTGTLRAHMREIVAAIVIEQKSQGRAFG